MRRAVRSFLAAAIVAAAFEGAVAGRAAEFEAFHKVPSPTRTPLPPARAEKDPMRSLSWLTGRWRVTGDAAGDPRAGVHEYTYGYGGTVLFVHEKLGPRERHGAISFDVRSGAYVMVSSEESGAVRLWKSGRTGEQMLVFLCDGALNRDGADGWRWTIRRNHEDVYDSYLDPEPPGPGRASVVLSGRLPPRKN